MNAISSALLQALNQLPKVAAAAHGDLTPSPLRELLRRIDTLAAQLPPPPDPALVHYLQRKSYDKARLRLEELKTASHQPDPHPAATREDQA